MKLLYNDTRYTRVWYVCLFHHLSLSHSSFISLNLFPRLSHPMEVYSKKVGDKLKNGVNIRRGALGSQFGSATVRLYDWNS